MTKRFVGVRFPQNTYDWLETEAAKTGTPVSALVRQGVELLQAERSLETTDKDKQIELLKRLSPQQLKALIRFRQEAKALSE
uniref:ribbon-helix-helix domain-containing protein n=1 Tax=Trichocoleus desertorum TaxID=1481672 RepID=UPI0025B4C2D7|nr:ribbon-helix-helix domain-containing protein [Trichocoleus desertorum]